MSTVTYVAEPLIERFKRLLPEAKEAYEKSKKKHDEFLEIYMRALREHSGDEDTSYIDACRNSYETYLEVFREISDAYETIENAYEQMKEYAERVEDEVMTYFQKGEVYVDKVISLVESMRAVPDIAGRTVEEFPMGNAVAGGGSAGMDSNALQDKIDSIYDDKSLNYQQKIARLNVILEALKNAEKESRKGGETVAEYVPLNTFVGENPEWLRNNYAHCSNEDMKNVSDAERVSLYEYSLDGYMDMNAYLDGRPILTNIPQYLEQVKRHVDNISSAIERNCLRHDTQLYRGHSFEELFSDPGDKNLSFDELRSKYVNSLKDKDSFMSTSTEPIVADKFDKCILEINAPKGTPALCMGGISAFDTLEAEVLIQKNMRYRIDDMWKENGKIHTRITIVGRGKV